MRKLLLFLMFVVTSTVSAQFYNDPTVYCYKCYKEVTDGVPKKVNYDEIEFIMFGNNQWMAQWTVDINRARDYSKKTHKQYMYEDPTYYVKHMQYMHETLSELLSGKIYNNWFCDYYKYEPQLSTSKKYTYINYYIKPHRDNSWPIANILKMDFEKGVWCYTFTLDKSEMIRWRADDASTLHYYKRVDPNEIGKVDLDFLK